jgi:hypothetical protein
MDDGGYVEPLDESGMYGPPPAGPSAGYLHPHCDGWSCASVACRCRFARLEFLSWWGAGNNLPVLVTDGVQPANTLFGGELIDQDPRGGGRVTIGKWFDGGQSVGLMARFYSVDDGTFDFTRTSEGGIPITRPFFSLENAGGQIVGPDGLQVAGNGIPGSISVVGRQRFTGVDVLYRRLINASQSGSVDFLIGYTTARLDEDLMIDSTSTLNAVNIGVRDLFDAKNEFHGVAVGVLGRRDAGRFGMEFLGKIAMGDMSQQMTLDGSATNSDFGLLIQSNNEGVFEDHAFVFAPEVGCNLVYRARPNLDIVFGYTLLYWSSVARPEDHIPQNLAVNPNNPPPADELPGPPFRFVHNDYWLQGLNLGVAFSF